jgi:hypothetical protein
MLPGTALGSARQKFFPGVIIAPDGSVLQMFLGFLFVLAGDFLMDFSPATPSEKSNHACGDERTQ